MLLQMRSCLVLPYIHICIYFTIIVIYATVYITRMQLIQFSCLSFLCDGSTAAIPQKRRATSVKIFVWVYSV